MTSVNKYLEKKKLTMLQNNWFIGQLCVHRDMKHLGSLGSTQEARVALGCTSSNSYASFVFSKLPVNQLLIGNFNHLTQFS